MFGGQVTCPIVIRMPGGAGHQLASQHSHSLEAWYSHVPGLKVVLPSTPFDAKGLLKTSIRDDDPVIFLESEGLYAKKASSAGPTTSCRSRAAVRRRGADCTVVALSRMVWVALSAADALAEDGVEVEVIDPRTLRPLDLETLAASVRRTGRAVVVEEGWPESGWPRTWRRACTRPASTGRRPRPGDGGRRPDAVREEPGAGGPAVAGTGGRRGATAGRAQAGRGPVRDAQAERHVEEGIPSGSPPTATPSRRASRSWRSRPTRPT